MILTLCIVLAPPYLPCSRLVPHCPHPNLQVACHWGSLTPTGLPAV